MADLRAQILEHTDDVKHNVEPVATPEWPEVDGQLAVCKLSAEEADAWEFSLFRQVGDQMRKDMRNMRAKLVVRTLVDADSGERVFGEGDAKHVGSLDAAVIGRVFEAARKLNGLVAAADEDAEGNSEPDRSDSGS